MGLVYNIKHQYAYEYTYIYIESLDKQQMNNSSKYVQEYGTNNKIGIFSSLQIPVSDL